LVLIILAAQFLRRDPSQMGQLPYGEDEVKEEGLNAKVGFSFQEAIRRVDINLPEWYVTKHK